MFPQALQNMLMSNAPPNNNHFGYFDESQNEPSTHNLMSQVGMGVHSSALTNLWMSSAGFDEDQQQQQQLQQQLQQQQPQKPFESIQMTDQDSDERKGSITSLSSYDSLSNDDDIFDIGANGITPIGTGISSVASSIVGPSTPEIFIKQEEHQQQPETQELQFTPREMTTRATANKASQKIKKKFSLFHSINIIFWHIIKSQEADDIDAKKGSQ
ncbi:unnamed protein product [Ambrosiozyma monospora]|uniref:Unnamed protein product n=1 Tax=Ambrosiozyma monospora TaxID=43982 RepID=A0A9W6T7I4_AMBMO|nr:unnamed protein product [Ambrosiozyma monospora]